MREVTINAVSYRNDAKASVVQGHELLVRKLFKITVVKEQGIDAGAAKSRTVYDKNLQRRDREREKNIEFNSRNPMNT